MENIKFKTLPAFLFIPTLLLVFLRPFLIDFIHPVMEITYEYSIIILTLICLFTNKKRILKNSYSLPLLLLLIAYSFSFFISISIQNSLVEISRLISYACMLILVSQADNKQKRLLLKAIVIAATAMSLYAIYQYYFGYPLIIDLYKGTPDDISLASSHVQDILIRKRAIGKFPTPDLLAGYLLMAFFLSLHLIRKMPANNQASKAIQKSEDSLKRQHASTFLNSKKRYLAPTLIIAALILTKSMGAWLCLILCLIFLFAVSDKSSKRKKLVLAITIVFTALILIFIILNRGERIINLNDQHNPITQRIIYWLTAANIIIRHTLTGIGLGNFQQAAIFFKAHPAMADIKFAHNVFLHHFAETGILGFIAFILLSVAFLKKFTLKSKYIFLAGLSFLLHNQIDFTYFISQVGMFWWIILGLAESPKPELADD